MNLISTSKWPGRTLGNLALTGSLFLHVGFIALFSSWQSDWKVADKNPPEAIQVKFLPAPPAQKDIQKPAPVDIAHFFRTPSVSAPPAPMSHLKARTFKLSASVHQPMPWRPQSMLSSKKYSKRRMVQRTTLPAMEAKPMAILLSKIFQPNHDATQHVKTRPSPILKTHPAKSVQGVAPVEVRAIGQPTVIQRRVPLLQAIFSNNPGPGSLNAFPMEIPMLVTDRVQPMKSPAPSQSGTTSPPTGIAAKAPEKYATPQTLRAKLAALPRKLTQNPSADREVPDANLNGLRGLFTGEVRQRIANAKYYPRIAKRRGMEGQPVIAFTLSKTGRLMKVDLARTSGYQLLDQAALEAVHQAAPYPEIPAELKTDTFQFKLPISFVLK